MMTERVKETKGRKSYRTRDMSGNVRVRKKEVLSNRWMERKKSESSGTEAREPTNKKMGMRKRH